MIYIICIMRRCLPLRISMVAYGSNSSDSPLPCSTGSNFTAFYSTVRNRYIGCPLKKSHGAVLRAIFPLEQSDINRYAQGGTSVVVHQRTLARKVPHNPLGGPALASVGRRCATLAMRLEIVARMARRHNPGRPRGPGAFSTSCQPVFAAERHFSFCPSAPF